MSPITENSIAFWDNVIAAATWLTLTVTTPSMDPEEAVIVAVPLATAVNRPEVDTVTTVESDVAQSTSTSFISLPLVSDSVTAARAVSPRAENEIDVSESSSDATIWLTVTVVCPLADPEEAVIVAVPLPTEVTRPDGETVVIE